MALFPCTNNEIDRLINGSITSVSSTVTTLKNYAFANSANLTSVNLPNVATIPTYCFLSCSGLSFLDFKQRLSIGLNAFTGSSLDTLILRNDTMSGLSNVNAFQSTPFWSSGTGGKLYVPNALIATYQANANWSALLGQNVNNQILAIEGSSYDS